VRLTSLTGTTAFAYRSITWLRSLLGIKVVAQANNYGELTRALESTQCDVVLMHLAMPAEEPA
jgi:DNA-binding NarL/FixJ family response regulator